MKWSNFTSHPCGTFFQKDKNCWRRKPPRARFQLTAVLNADNSASLIFWKWDRESERTWRQSDWSTKTELLSQSSTELGRKWWRKKHRKIKCHRSSTWHSIPRKCWYGRLEAWVLTQRFGNYFHHHKIFPLLCMTCFHGWDRIGKTWNLELEELCLSSGPSAQELCDSGWVTVSFAHIRSQATVDIGCWEVCRVSLT